MRLEVLSRDDVDGHIHQSTHHPHHNMTSNNTRHENGGGNPSVPKVKSLDDFVLTRRPTARSTAARADGSPSSLAVDSRKKHHGPESTTISTPKQQQHSTWSNFQDQGSVKTTSMASQSTPATAYSSSSSQSTRGGNDTIYSKPEEDFSQQTFSEHDSLLSSSRRYRRHQQNAATQKGSQTRDHVSMFTLARDEESMSASGPILGGNFMDTEERHYDDDGSDSESSAALDAFLDTRLKSLLELPDDETTTEKSTFPSSETTSASMRAGMEITATSATTTQTKSAAHRHNGTQDDPVDLTSTYSARFANTKANVGSATAATASSTTTTNTEGDEANNTTPTRPNRRRSNQSPSDYLTPQRKSKSERIVGSTERTVPRSPYQHHHRRRRRNSSVSNASLSPHPPATTTGTTTPKQQQQQQNQTQQQMPTFPRLSSVSVSSSATASARGKYYQRGSSFFNPLLSGTSPIRGMRRSSFMVGGIFSTSQSTGNLAYARRQMQEYDDDDDDDESSIDSLELLEMWSHQIQSELRHEAVVELAMEAERAAEQGLERFSSTSRPWMAYDLSSSSPGRSIKRVASYSEGVTPMRRGSATGANSILPLRKIPKVPIHELRDVDEVFPSLNVFHKNLRTHMARNNVDETTLIFEERKSAEVVGTSRPPLGASAFQVAMASDQQSVDSGIGELGSNEGRQGSFLGSFSFDLLGTSARSMPKGNVFEEKKSEDHEDGIGDILADHIRPTKGEHRPPPKRETLPGMEDLTIEISTSNKATPPKGSRKSPGPPSPKRGQSSAKEQAPSPRALFDAVENDLQTASDLDSLDGDKFIGDNSSIVSETPLMDQSKPDFITPAKLRRIRRKDVPKDPNLLPVASLLNAKSPNTVEGIRRPNHDPTSPAGSDKTPPALLLPTLPHAEGESPASRNSVLRPVISQKQKHLHTRSMSVDSDILESDDDARGRDGKPRLRRRFKHMFGNGTALGKTRPSKALDDSQEFLPLLKNADQPLQPQYAINPSPSIEQEDDDQPPKEITTPAYADCNCLTLSPSPSLDEFGIPRNNGTHRVHRADSPEPFAAAMKMISHHLSPNQEKQRRKLLYVGLQENDDFMQNFLYCGKHMGPPKQPDTGFGNNRICGDDRCEDGVAAMANTCYATFVLDDDHDLAQESALAGCGPVIQAGAYHNHSLFGQTPLTKLEPDTWFDVATEKVDGVIERLVGSTPQNEWNLSFQPPSLRKNTANSVVTDTSRGRRGVPYKGTLDPMEETILDASLSPGSSVQQVSTASVNAMTPRPSTPPVVALFPSPGHDLSDDQFKLIYGMSRPDHERLVGRQQDRTLGQDQQSNQAALRSSLRNRHRPANSATERTSGNYLKHLAMPLPSFKSDSGVEDQATTEQMLAMTKSY